MDGPNFNSVLIAFFGTINAAIFAYVAVKTATNGRKIDVNTDQTIKAKVAARQAVAQTNGGLEPMVRAIVAQVKAEDSAAKMDRLLKEVEQRSKERPKLHDPDKS